MILREGLVFIVVCCTIAGYHCLTPLPSESLDFSEGRLLHNLAKRDSSQTDPKTYLDQVIEHWIYKIPFLIDESVDQSEKDLRFSVAKKVTQGWSIVIASWKDIYSDFVNNERTLGNLGDITVIYNYGFLFTYGIGFGYPLLLGLPDDTKGCGRNDFLDTLDDYQLGRGISNLVYQGASPADIQSVLVEFERVIGTKLSCIDSSENVESLIATNAVSNLLAAMSARLELESASATSFQSRKLDLVSEELKDLPKFVADVNSHAL